MVEDWDYVTPPPTEEELFEMFCYEMYLKYRDEVFEWEGKMPTATSEDYIKKNLDMIKDLYKEQQKNG
jgi:hypothetical protein